MTQVWYSLAAVFNQQLLNCLHEAATQDFGNAMNMISSCFAGHYSGMTVLHVPTAMVSVPCRDGVSHAADEFSASEQWYASAAIPPCAITEQSFPAPMAFIYS